jgi:hypothetical protein
MANANATVNPLDASQGVSAGSDHPSGAPVGVPGVASPDMIVQNFVNVMQDEINHANAFALANYHGQLFRWNQNNQFGIFGPAPQPVTLVVLNQTAAANYEETGEGSAAMLSTTQYWEVPPGLVLQAPAKPTPIPQPANPVGAKIVNTSNLYEVVAGDTHANGGTWTDESVTPNVVYTKLASPLGDAVWMRN